MQTHLSYDKMKLEMSSLRCNNWEVCFISTSTTIAAEGHHSHAESSNTDPARPTTVAALYDAACAQFELCQSCCAQRHCMSRMRATTGCFTFAQGVVLADNRTRDPETAVREWGFLGLELIEKMDGKMAGSDESFQMYFFRRPHPPTQVMHSFIWFTIICFAHALL